MLIMAGAGSEAGALKYISDLLEEQPATPKTNKQKKAAIDMLRKFSM
jgi:hypothetical protein